MGFAAICTALYDYQPQGAGELDIREGELLYILEKSTEDDWWKARKKAGEDEEDEPEGLIPSNYVEDVTPSHSAKALYDYSRQTDEEVSFSEDAAIDVYDISDPDWTLVGVNDEFGFAPANYIEISGTAAKSPSVASAQQSAPAPADPITPTTPTSPARGASGPAADLARVLGGGAPSPAATRGVPPPPAPQQQLTPEASDSEEPAPALPRRPPSQTVAPPVIQHATYQEEEPAGVLPSPPYNRASARREDDEAPMRSPGGYHLYNVNEMVSAMGRRKKMPTTLGLNVATGTIMLMPEKSRDGPQQEWTADKLSHYSIEGKHVFMELIRPSKSLDLHAGAKDTAEEIVATLGEIAGAAKGEGIKEVIAAAAGGGAQRKGKVLYDFMAQGDDEVTVAVDDEVVVLDDTKSEDWWNVRRLKNGKEGVMPSSYIEVTGTVPAEPPSRAGVNAGRSTVEQNRLEEQRLAKEAARSNRSRGDSQSKAEVGPGMQLPARGSSLAEEDTRKSRKDKRSSKADGKSRSKPNPNKIRTWTDHSGSFKVEAQFIGVADGKIHLHKANGVKIAVPVSKMSPADLEYIEKVTQESIEDNMPVADLIKMKQKARAGQSGASIQPTQPKVSDYDWFDFFLKAGVGPHQCDRYAQAMVRDSMDESVLPDISHDTLRTLGLKEGDALKVMKHLDQRYGRTRGPSTNGEGGLFSGPGGALHNNTGRSRPEANRQTSNAVDPAVFNKEEKPAEAKETPLTKAPAAEKGFDDDAWAVKPPPQPARTPAAQPAPKPPTGAMADLSLLDTVTMKPLEPTPAPSQPIVQSPPPSQAAQQPSQQPAPPQQPQQTGATPSFFSQLGQQQTGLSVPRQRPAPPPQQSFAGSLLPPPQRPLSAPQNPQQSQFGPQPLQPQLTGVPQRQAPYGQSLEELNQQRMQQQQFQQMQLQPQQTGFMQQGFGQYPNGLAPQPTGFQQFQQPYLNGNAQESPFADPKPQFQPQPTGFGQFPQGQTPGGINSMLPPALQPQPTGFAQNMQQTNGQFQAQPTGFQQPMQPQPTGFMQSQPTGFQPLQPQQTGFGQQPGFGQPQQNGFGSFQAPPVPPIPQQSPAPLQPQKTGPAPDVRFGAAKKLAPQPTGRKANLAAASKSLHRLKRIVLTVHSCAKPIWLFEYVAFTGALLGLERQHCYTVLVVHVTDSRICLYEMGGMEYV